MTPDTDSAPRRSTGRWSPLIISVLAAMTAVGLVWWWMAQPTPLAEAAGSGPGEYVIEMHDYSFRPASMTWHVGEKVTLTFVNDSEAHPGKTHEFMMGRDPRRTSTMLGINQMDGFEHDFFAGLTVWFGHAQGVEMLMPGEANVQGSEAPQYYMRMSGSSGSMDMSSSSSSMDMSSSSTSMDMSSSSSDTSTESPTPMSTSSSGMDSSGGGMVAKGNGLMVVVKPGGRATVEFTVPDRPGTWTYGCFQQSGQHFLNGMSGTVTIVK